MGASEAGVTVPLFRQLVDESSNRLRGAAQDFFLSTGDVVAQSQAYETMERAAGDIAIIRGAQDFQQWKAHRDYVVSAALAQAEC